MRTLDYRLFDEHEEELDVTQYPELTSSIQWTRAAVQVLMMTRGSTDMQKQTLDALHVLIRRGIQSIRFSDGDTIEDTGKYQEVIQARHEKYFDAEKNPHTESTPLYNKEEMLERLQDVLSEHGFGYPIDKFFLNYCAPVITQFADMELNEEEVISAIMVAVQKFGQYAAPEQYDPVLKSSPHVIDAMVIDPAFALHAKKRLIDGIKPPTILQTVVGFFKDYTHKMRKIWQRRNQ